MSRPAANDAPRSDAAKYIISHGQVINFIDSHIKSKTPQALNAPAG
jgi:hypothetical protein